MSPKAQMSILVAVRRVLLGNVPVIHESAFGPRTFSSAGFLVENLTRRQANQRIAQAPEISNGVASMEERWILYDRPLQVAAHTVLYTFLIIPSGAVPRIYYLHCPVGCHPLPASVIACLSYAGRTVAGM